MNLLDGYGMDTITMAGTLEAKLSAMKGAGFSQVMLMARDLVTHPGGVNVLHAHPQPLARHRVGVDDNEIDDTARRVPFRLHQNLRVEEIIEHGPEPANLRIQGRRAVFDLRFSRGSDAVRHGLGLCSDVVQQ
jgi:hypothetical protein